MKWSLKLGSFAGIGVFVHWTFVLLIGWVLFMYRAAGQTWLQALGGVIFVLALFVCIVMHEFGHALTARRYGVGTRDITLLPIGGVARLERIPEDPMQEFWVAVAGPAVNLVIAAVLFAVLLLLDGTNRLLDMEWFGGGGHFLTQLMWVNLFVVAFNLLPAFPMDGGRVLRALLSRKLGRQRATAVAANIGQGMAVLFGIIGFLQPNPFLIFIAIFVYLGAQGEAAHVETRSALQGLRVHDAMMTRFRTLSADDPLDRALTELLAGSQQDFPVLDGGGIRGVLCRNDLVKALTDGRRGARVGEIELTPCQPVDESADLIRTLEMMRETRCATLPVTGSGGIVGLLTTENIGELLMLHAAIAHGGTNRPDLSR